MRGEAGIVQTKSEPPPSISDHASGVAMSSFIVTASNASFITTSTIKIKPVASTSAKLKRRRKISRRKFIKNEVVSARPASSTNDRARFRAR